MALQPRFDGIACSGIARQFPRLRFVALEGIRHQFWQADGMQKACRHAPRESVAHAGQNRKPDPQRIGRGGVGVVGQGVEEEIRQFQPRKVVHGRRQIGREHNPMSSNTAGLGFTLEISPCRIIGLSQPQHAFLHAFEQAHPNFEYRRGDLVARVETAKDETVGGQTQLLSREDS